MKKALFQAFPALHERNFRLYFYGQIVSLAGTYLQSTAQAWLVLQITHSAFWVGVVASLVFFPTFLLVLFGGAIVDRFDKRKLLYGTQIAAMVLALTLGILTLTGHVTLWEICVLAFLLGMVNAVDSPARTAFVPDMITNRDHLASGMSINTGLITAAQAIGPAIAGILITVIGIGGTFVINAATFLAVIAALYGMRLAIHEKVAHPVHPFLMVKHGIAYLRSMKGFAFLIGTSFAMALVGRGYTSIFPVLATEFYHGDSKTLGWLLSAFGAGAAVGGVFLSRYMRRLSSRQLLIGGMIVSGIGIMCVPFSPSIAVGVIAVFLGGAGFATTMTTIITIFQHASSREMRGRVLSIFYFTFFGGYALSNFVVGIAAERYGSAPVVACSGLGLAILAVVLFFLRDRILEIE